MTTLDPATWLLRQPLPMADAADAADADPRRLRDRLAMACPSLHELTSATAGLFLHHSAAYRIGDLRVCAAAHLQLEARGERSTDCTLLLPTRGRACCSVGGRHYALEPGACAMLLADDPWTLGTDLYAGITVGMPRTRLQEALTRLTGGPVFHGGSLRIPLHRAEARRTMSALPAMLRTALHLAETGAHAERGFVEGEVVQAIAELVADALNLVYIDFRTGDRARGVDAACGYMLEHLGDPLTLTDLECHTAIARHTLDAQFRERLGMSPLRWLKQQRLLAARRLLLIGAYDGVTETALACGFTHTGRFSRDFKAAFGIPPSAARRAAPH